MNDVRRAATVLAGLLTAHAAVGLVLARDLELTAARGALVGSAAFEVLGASFNPLGALVALALGAVALAGALAMRPWLLLASAMGHALLGLQVLVQYGHEVNWLGSRGSNLSLAIAAAAGLVALAVAMRHHASMPERQDA